ncbi:MAG: succinate dehydrogenase, hydrophobic membrane anchor protein [Neisseria sp.]|nr:succinate dehydrogenase, hydrophobic membrane anchor protein [Neisseria sp.]
MVNRTLTGAHYGWRDWITQRVTAVILLVYTAMLLIGLVMLPKEYAAWQAFFSHTVVRIFTQVTLIALLLHAWIGIRDMWMDYIKPVGLRLTMHVLTALWLVGCLIYSVKVIWGV